MPDNNKQYYVFVPGEEQGRVVDAATFESNKDKLYAQYPNAEVAEMTGYNPEDTDLNDRDQYQVMVPGMVSPTTVDSKTFNNRREELFKQYPDAQVTRIRDYSDGYWRPKLEEAQAALADFDMQHGKTMNDYETFEMLAKNSEQGEIPNFNSPAHQWLREHDAEYQPLKKQRDALRSAIYNNPLENKGRKQAYEQAMAASDSFMKLAEQAESGAERRDYKRAAKLQRDAAKMWSAPGEYDQLSDGENGFSKYMEDYKKGAGKTFSDKDFWTRGLTQIARDIDLYGIRKKIQEAEKVKGGPLDEGDYDRLITPSEKAQLFSFYELARAQAKRANDLSSAYKAGESAAESLGFMAEFLLSQGLANVAGKALSASSNGFARWMGQALMSEKALNRAVAKGVTTIPQMSRVAKVGTELARPVVQGLWHTTTQLSTLSNMAQMMNQTNDEGELNSVGRGIWLGFADSLVENWSESVGNNIEKGFGLVGEGIASIGTKTLGKTTFGQMARWALHSPFALTLKEAGFNGFFGEMLEEWAGNAVRLATGLMDGDEFKQFASVQQQLEMAASFAPMSLFGLAGNTVSSFRNKSEYERLAEKTKGILMRNGVSQAEIDALFNKKWATSEDIAAGLAPYAQQIINSDSQTAKADYKTVLELAQMAGAKSFNEAVEGIVSEQERSQMKDVMVAQMGQNFWQDYDSPTAVEEDGTPVQIHQVRVVDYADGTHRYIVGGYGIGENGNKSYATIDDNGQYGYISDSEIAQGMEAGNITADRELMLDDYLQERVDAAKKSVESKRLQQELQQNYAALQQRVLADPKIDIGTPEHPVIATVVTDLISNKGVLVQYEHEGQLVNRSMTWSEVATYLNMPLYGKTDAQLTEEAAIEQQKAEQRKEKYNKIQPGTPVTVMMDMGGEAPIAAPYRFAKAIFDANEGIVRIYMQDENGQAVTNEKGEEVWFPEDMVQGLDAISEQAQQEANVEEAPAEEPVVEEAQPAVTRYTGKDGRVNQTSFIKNEPEEWAKWNDARRQDNGDNTMQRLSAAIAELDANITKSQKEWEKESNPDEADKKEEALNALKERRERLNSILQTYVAERKAIKEAEDAAQREAFKKEVDKKKEAEKAVRAKIQDDLQADTDFVAQAERYAGEKKTVGAKETINVQGRKYTGHWVVSEVTTPKPSHNPLNDYAPTPGYPIGKAGNTNHYDKDKRAQQITQEMADHYDERAVQEAVMVTKHGIVISGNGRTQAALLAATQGTDAAYQEYIRTYPYKWGLTAEQINEYEHPFIYFELDEDVEYTAALFDAFNRSTSKQQGVVETATKVAQMTSDDLIMRLDRLFREVGDSLDSLYNNPQKVNELLNILQEAGLFNANERARYVNEGGELNGAGEDLVNSVLFGTIFSSSDQAIRDAMADKSIGRAIAYAFPTLVRIRNLSGEYSIIEELTQAVSLLARAKESNKGKAEGAIEDYMNQYSLFSEGLPVEKATVQLLAHVLNSKKYASLRSVLDQYIDRAEAASNGQMDMFTGDVEAKERIVRDVLDYNNIKIETYDNSGTPANAEMAPAAPEQGSIGSGAQPEGTGAAPAAQSSGNSAPVDTSNPLDVAAKVAAVNRRLEKWKKFLGDIFVVHTDTSTVEDAAALAEIQKQDAAVAAGESRDDHAVRGWFDPKTGKAHIYLPHLLEMSNQQRNLDQTILHEVISHKGLRALFNLKGEGEFNKFLDWAWDNLMSDEAKSFFLEYVHGSAYDEASRRAAADEFFAHAAESNQAILKQMDETFWTRLADALKNFINDAVGEDLFTDADMDWFSQLLQSAMMAVKEGAKPIQQEDSGSLFSVVNAFSKSKAEFDAMQKRAEEKHGLVASGLYGVEFPVKDVQRHDFTGTGKQAIEKARKWADGNIVGVHKYHEGQADEFSYEITGGKEGSIGKMLSSSSTSDSKNLGVHLAVLKELPAVIDASLDIEIHPDYIKEDGTRTAENKINKERLIHRLYGAVNIDGTLYRVKTTIHENRDAENNVYTYKVTEVELLISGSTTSDALSNSTITATKLLNGVEKSYDSGKKLLDAEYLDAVEEGDMEKAASLVSQAAASAMPETKVVDKYKQPLVVYHGSLAKGITSFDKERIGTRYSFDDRGFFFVSSPVLAGYYASSEFNADEKGQVYPVYINATHPLVVDNKFARKHKLGKLFPQYDVIDVWDNYQSFILDEVDKAGSDGVIIDDGQTQMVVAFEPGQIKSAEPVTKDNDNKVVPLSERFNFDSDDIRFSKFGQTARLQDELGTPSTRISELIDRNATEGTILFSQKDGSEKTLVGLHNISAEKLSGAIRMGGLANPSAAVIDLSHQDHFHYGEITFVLPSSLVDSKTGQNIGTFDRDAWTPTYPEVEYYSTKETERKLKELTAGLPDELAYRIRRCVDEYMDKNVYNSGLEYLFLKEKGEEIGMQKIPRKYPNLTLEKIWEMLGIPADTNTSNHELWYDAYEKLSPEKRLEFNVMFYTKGEKDNADYIRDKEYAAKSEKAREFIRDYYSKPISFGPLDSFIYGVMRDQRDAGKEDANLTIEKAVETVREKGYAQEFGEWQTKIIDNLGYDERIYCGRRSDGSRILKPHTLENVSKYMKKQGRNASDDHGTTGAGMLKARLAQKFKTLQQIRAHKDQLVNYGDERLENLSDRIREAVFTFYDAELASSSGMYTAELVAQEYAEDILVRGMDVEKVIERYNAEEKKQLNLSEEEKDELRQLRKDLVNIPAFYFETKFERPVTLDEFAAVVLPKDTPEAIKEHLRGVNIPMFEYDSDDNNSRSEAVRKATEADGIRFSVTDYNDETANRELQKYITNTPEFKEWFNGSKVVDEDGEPLEVFRGADYDPLAQEPGMGVIKPQAYFSPSKEYAQRYGLWTRGYYLNIKNPFDVRNKEDMAILKSMLPDWYDVHVGASGALDWAELSAFDLDELIEQHPEYDGIILDEAADPDGNGGVVSRGISYMPFHGGAQVKSATSNNGEFSSENPDVRFSVKRFRDFTEAQKAQKLAGHKYDDFEPILFSLSKNNRSTISKWLQKRDDLSSAQKEAFIGYLDSFNNPTLQLATARWFASGVIRLPEDMSKVEQAVSVAGKAKVDPLQYSSPMELLEAHAEFQPTEKRINPDKVSTLHKAKELEHGIVIYDVDESMESRQNMREIINSHFGKEASPWCLLQGDGNGNLTSSSAQYWRTYSGYPKQVAFKDGKLLAFSANMNENRVWWDRQDRPSTGVPVAMKIPDDALGRSANFGIDSETGEVMGMEGVHRGNKQNGFYEEWTDDGKQQLSRVQYKDGKKHGIEEAWHSNGQRYKLCEFREGVPVGDYESWYDNGNPCTVLHYDKEGKIQGEALNYYSNGQLDTRWHFKDNHWDGVKERWDDNGVLLERTEFEAGLRHGTEERFFRDGERESITHYDHGQKDGLMEEWWWNGNKRSHINFKQDMRIGVTYTWWENGAIKSRVEFDDEGMPHGVAVQYYDTAYADSNALRLREHWNHGDRHGIYEEFDSKGTKIIEKHFVNGLEEGIHKEWFDNGVLREISTYRGGKMNGIQEQFTSGGTLWSRELVKDDVVQQTFGNGGQSWYETGNATRFSVVTDQKELDWLNNQPTITLYRAMELIDGVLYPPMSQKIPNSKEDRGKRMQRRKGSQLGVWEKSDEDAAKAYQKEEGGPWYYDLKKIGKDQSDVNGVLYNPYFHLSASPLNDQFSAASTRPNLVIVACEIPISELTSGYKAEKANDAVGAKDWHSGTVTAQLGEGRQVVLSRWAKPVRIVPDSEVASMIAPKLVEKDIVVPVNVVTPSLKSALEKRGVKFSDAAKEENVLFSRANNSQEVFISNAQAAVESIPMEKATPQQWLKMIESRGGLKAGEDKWIGLSEWLQAQTGKTVSKKEIVEYIAQNRIQIEETNYTDAENIPMGDDSEWDDAVEARFGKEVFEAFHFYPGDGGTSVEFVDEDKAAELYRKLSGQFNMAHYTIMTPAFGEPYSRLDMYWMKQLAERIAEYGDKEMLTRYGRTINPTRLDYTMDGLTNKREIALSVPGIEPWNADDEIHFGDAGNGRAVVWVRFGDTLIRENMTQEGEEAVKAKSDFLQKMFAKYGETGAKLYGAMNDEEMREVGKLIAASSRAHREAEKRVLFIDEIQSKRHQTGRDKGYMTPEEEKKSRQLRSELVTARRRLDSYAANIADHYGWDVDVRPEDLLARLERSSDKDKDALEWRKHLAKLIKEKDTAVQAVREYKHDGVPEAPFEKNWHELALKRMLRLAAEEGYDYVAWTTGAEQAGRYAIGRMIDFIEVGEWDDEEMAKDGVVIPKMRKLRLMDNGGGETIIDVYGDNGEIRSGEFIGHSLHDVVGKSLAEKLLTMDAGRIEGEGLHLGGEGMKGFYDDMLPRFMNKYGKKWGVKVEDKQMSPSHGARFMAHAVPVTEEMKASVMEGQLMFSRTPDMPVQGRLFTEDGRVVRYESEGGLPKQEGRTCLVERTYQKSKMFSFMGKDKIESEGDVAYIFRELETAAIENSFIVYVKDGVPTILHTGIGDMEHVMVDEAAFAAGLHDFQPDQIYMVHNHPSGNVGASAADIKEIAKLQQMAKKIPVQGIIIDTLSGEYGLFDADMGSMLTGRSKDNEGFHEIEVKTFDKAVFSAEYKESLREKRVTNAEAVAAYLSAHRLGDGQKVGALFTNHDGRVVGNLVLNEGKISGKNADKVAGEVINAGVHCAANNVIFFGDFAYDTMSLKVVKALIDTLGGGKLTVQDVVRIEGNRTLSADAGTLHDSVRPEELRFSKSNESQEVFVSNAELAVEGIPMGKATPEQWLKMLDSRGGLKAGEDKWLGLSDWLKSQDKKTITKQEIVDYIAQNRIQIEDVNYADDVDLEAGFEKYTQETVGKGKSLDELQSEIDEIIESHPEWEDLEPYEYGNQLMEEMKERYGDDFEMGYFIDDDNELQYNIDPYELDEDSYNDITNGTKKSTSMRLMYTTNGLQNKREIALVVPSIEPWNTGDTTHFGDAGQGRAIAWVRFGDTETLGPVANLDRAVGYMTDRKRVTDMLEYNQSELDRGVRGRMREDAQARVEDAKRWLKQLDEEYPEFAGKAPMPVLVIDEIQSKRHQEGREHGYRDQEITELKKKMDRLGEIANGTAKDEKGDTIPYTNEVKAELQAVREEWMEKTGQWYHVTLNDITVEEGNGVWKAEYNGETFRVPMHSYTKEGAHKELVVFINAAVTGHNRSVLNKYSMAVPAAPFEKNWHELAFKRMLRLAAEEGFEYVAWTTGKQQAERYGIGQVLYTVEAGKWTNDDEAGDGRKFGEESKSITLYTKNGEYSLDINREGNVLSADMSELTGKHLSEVLGKELAKKIIEEEGTGTYSGDDIRVGGEGMKGFYDLMLPAFVNKYAKKWGAKVEDIVLPTLEEAGKVMHAIQVTPEMRESVLQGQTMFSKSHAASERAYIGGIGAVIGQENVGSFYMDIYKAMPVETRKEMVDRTLGRNLNFRETVADYISDLAATGNDETGLLRLAMNQLREYAGELEEKDARYILWRAERKEDEGDMLDVAHDQFVRNRLGIGKQEQTQLEDSGAAPKTDIEQAREEVDTNPTDAQKAAGNYKKGHVTIDGYDISLENPKGSVRSGKDAKGNEWSVTMNNDYGYIRMTEGVDGDHIDIFLSDNPEEGKVFVVDQVNPDNGEFDEHKVMYGFNSADEAKTAYLANYSEGWKGLGSITEVSKEEFRKWVDSSHRKTKPFAEYKSVDGIRFSIKDELNAADAAAESAADAAKDALDAKKKEMKKDLLTMVKAMNAQKEYDRGTVEALTELAKSLMKDQFIDELSRREVSRLLGIVRSSVGKSAKTVKKNADALVDMVIDNLLKRERAGLKKLTSTTGTKTNATGVEVQGELDIQGQKTIKAFKEGITHDVGTEGDDETMNTLYGLRARLADRLASKDDAVRKDAEAEDAGLALAIEYKEGVKALVDEEKELEDTIKKLNADLNDKNISKSDHAEQVKATEDALRENHIDQVEAIRAFRHKMQEMMSGSADAKKSFVEREKERVEHIHHLANSDMQGRTADTDKKPTFWDKLANSPIVRFFMAPLATFDQMLRLFGEKNVAGEGYLWNKYMRDWQEATARAYTGQRDAKAKLDEKVAQVFGREGMKWADLFDEERKMDTVTIKWMSADGEMKEHDLTQGQLLYILMVDKMSDGRMKLRKMGIMEEDVAAIRAQMDERFIELADWLQGEYLVELRNKYNAVHERLFGASMAAIDDYFPLVINKRDLTRAEDIASLDYESLPSTTTGSIIKRRRNNKALDLLNADAFAVVLSHINQMEQWAAFAEFNKDINALLSYKRFRNQVQNMASVYGSGKTLWQNFKDVCRIAGNAYHPSVKIDSLDSAAVNLAKGVTSAKISFRVYTALKQFLSMPAFVADANILHLAKDMATPWKAWNWAMENLPLFEKRWKSRIAGDTRLMTTDMDWKVFRSKMYQTLSRMGMTPNAFVDAWTVAVGAHAMYQTKYDRYIKEGFSEEEADKKAKQDATTLYNETQQSNENAFLSTVQLDRTVFATAISVFRNSSMGFQRQAHDAIRNLGKMLQKGYKEQSIAFMTKQLLREGLSEEQAAKAAEGRYNRALTHNAVRVATFAFLVQFAWNLGGSLAYLLFGDDDDQKDAMLEEAFKHALVGGTIEGLSGGNVLSEAMNMVVKGESLRSYDPTLLPILSDMKRVYNMMGYDKVSGANELVNLAVQAGIGVNPQTLTDAVVAVIDACHGDLETSKEAMLLIMRVLQVPQSQVDQIYIDELGMKAGDAKRLSPSKMAERYATYKLMKGAPLTGWAYTDELKDKRHKAYKKSFQKKVKERKELKKK